LFEKECGGEGRPNQKRVSATAEAAMLQKSTWKPLGMIAWKRGRRTKGHGGRIPKQALGKMGPLPETGDPTKTRSPVKSSNPKESPQPMPAKSQTKSRIAPSGTKLDRSSTSRLAKPNRNGDKKAPVVPHSRTPPEEAKSGYAEKNRLGRENGPEQKTEKIDAREKAKPNTRPLLPRKTFAHTGVFFGNEI